MQTRKRKSATVDNVVQQVDKRLRLDHTLQPAEQAMAEKRGTDTDNSIIGLPHDTEPDSGIGPTSSTVPSNSRLYSLSKDENFDSESYLDKYNSNPDFQSVLLWTEALTYVRRILKNSSVELAYNFASHKGGWQKIKSVAFRGVDSPDKDSTYVFKTAAVVRETIWPTVPRCCTPFTAFKFHRSEIRQCFENISRIVLKHDVPDVQQKCGVLTSYQYWSITKSVLGKTELMPSQTRKLLTDLRHKGESAYQTRTAMKIQQAFQEGMRDSPGREGLKALLEYITDIVNDENRLYVNCHGTSNDQYGVKMSFIPAIQEISECVGGGGDQTDEETDAGACSEPDDNHPFKTPKQVPESPRGRGRGRGRRASSVSVETDAGTSGEPDDSHTVKNFSQISSPKGRGRSASSGSATRKSADDQKRPYTCTVNADMTVLVRKEYQAYPLLVVEIKSKTVDDAHSLQMLKHLLGGLQFRDEIFGLLISQDVAYIYRMAKNHSEKKIVYTYRIYYLMDYDMIDNDDRMIFQRNSFVEMCGDLLEICRYGLEIDTQYSALQK